MVEQLEPLKELDAVEQAVYFHSRERRKSLAGVVELFRTHRFVGSSAIAAPIPAAAFADVLAAPITFVTVIRIADNVLARSGLVFEYGDVNRAIALWLTDQTLSFRAGDAIGTGSAIFTFDNGVQWPATLELEIVATVRTGSGQIGVYANGSGTPIARAQAAAGTMAGWANADDGSFASAASGALPADVTTLTAPANFEVVEPLSGYTRQHPRQFLLPA